MAVPGAAGPGAGYPQWLYNPQTHTVSKVTSAVTKAAAETVSWPAKLIFFTSQAAADAYAKSQGGGGDISNSPVTGAANTGTDKAAQAVGSALGSAFSLKAGGSFLVRLAEGILGIILIAVGLARLTHAVPVATKIAGAVA